MRILCLIVMASGLYTPILFAREPQTAAPGSAGAARCEEAITVFQDVSRIGRRDGAAKNITQRHQEMAEQGWHFVDMEVYTENGDLEGFYLSYTRETTCPAGTRN